MKSEPQLTEYVPLFDGPGSYVASRPVLVTENRVRWLWRHRRADLVHAGAAIWVAGRIYVHPQRLDEIFLQIFRAQALARAEPIPALPPALAAALPRCADALIDETVAP